MVDRSYVESQLKKIKFGTGRVNRAEILELENILLPDETIYECVNGFYDGGVALLVATDVRVLLIDKKPMGFLNIDDVRFDMISDIDYAHRIFGATISINCGNAKLVFKSYNQQRLRKLIGHVQHRMSEIKKEQSSHAQSQKQHLEEINKQLQMYLLAQQQQLERQIEQNQPVQPLKPSPQLADYLFAQRLMENFQNNNNNFQKDIPVNKENVAAPAEAVREPIKESNEPKDQNALMAELVEAGRMEIFGGSDKISHASRPTVVQGTAASHQGVDLTPFHIAYAKLPYLLKSRRYKAAA